MPPEPVFHSARLVYRAFDASSDRAHLCAINRADPLSLLHASPALLRPYGTQDLEAQVDMSRNSLLWSVTRHASLPVDRGTRLVCRAETSSARGLLAS